MKLRILESRPTKATGQDISIMNPFSHPEGTIWIVIVKDMVLVLLEVGAKYIPDERYKEKYIVRFEVEEFLLSLNWD